MERRKYRNRLRQPVPLELPTKSISVPAKGYFVLEECDWVSPLLAKRISEGIIELVETVCVVEAKEPVEERAPEVPKEVPVEAPEPKADDVTDGATEAAEMQPSGTDNVGNKEQIDDSLTSSKEVVELDSEETTDSGDGVGETEDSESKAKVKRSRRKKKASRE